MAEIIMDLLLPEPTNDHIARADRREHYDTVEVAMQNPLERCELISAVDTTSDRQSSIGIVASAKTSYTIHGPTSVVLDPKEGAFRNETCAILSYPTGRPGAVGAVALLARRVTRIQAYNTMPVGRPGKEVIKSRAQKELNPLYGGQILAALGRLSVDMPWRLLAVGVLPDEPTPSLVGLFKNQSLTN